MEEEKEEEETMIMDNLCIALFSDVYKLTALSFFQEEEEKEEKKKKKKKYIELLA